jgi:hypothetical protein
MVPRRLLFDIRSESVEYSVFGSNSSRKPSIASMGGFTFYMNESRLMARSIMSFKN